MQSIYNDYSHFVSSLFHKEKKNRDKKYINIYFSLLKINLLNPYNISIYQVSSMRAWLHSISIFCAIAIAVLCCFLWSSQWQKQICLIRRVNHLYIDLIPGHRLKVHEHIIFCKSKPISLFHASFTIPRWCTASITPVL